MDGPYRAPRPGQGRVVSRPGATNRKAEEAQPAPAASHATTHHSFAPHQQTGQAAAPSTRKRLKLPLLAVLAVAVVFVLGFFVWTQVKSPATAIDTSKYQAVFFTNGQVYFGKLENFNSESMKLKDVYYLQTQTGTDADSGELQQTATSQNNVQLIKLGDEIHGPQDEMVISKDQLLFFENLKPEGKVSQSIEQHKKSK